MNVQLSRQSRLAETETKKNEVVRPPEAVAERQTLSVMMLESLIREILVFGENERAKI